ncbi:hypothetical protein LF1_34220 [Rubripirellula obstinata]|uniref:Uncharacterized protein n=1 Tax=Rubripirellula obstinata TaxID=406547 RepID=A0A5B1CMT1_9BACT|nr:hypothetical protein LF1_34220 [Rubripirellula obstinata]
MPNGTYRSPGRGNAVKSFGPVKPIVLFNRVGIAWADENVCVEGNWTTLGIRG